MGQDNPRVVLVTGGSGLVGHALQDVVGTDGNSQDQWHFVGSKDVDLRDAQQTRELFERVRPTHVIHLAALVGGLFHNLNRKVDFFRDNMAIDDSVLQSCQLLGVQKLISCLSTCVFPADTTYPLDETMLHNGRPPISNEGYAMTKRLIDTLNRCYADQFGCNFTSVTPPPPQHLRATRQLQRGQRPCGVRTHAQMLRGQARRDAVGGLGQWPASEAVHLEWGCGQAAALDVGPLRQRRACRWMRRTRSRLAT